MSEDLPKQELLLKLLKMTTSTNDGEAVVAIRKANALLTANGWDWDKLIHAKIKIVEDPFKTTFNPFENQPVRARPAPPAPPTPVYRPQPAPPPPPRPAPPPPRPHQPLGGRDNLYGGWCYCCGNPVDPKAGWLFDPSVHCRSARSKLQIICDSCNKTVKSYNVLSSAAPRRRQMVGGATPNLNDI